MSDIPSSLRTYLLTDSDVSTAFSTRIYVNVAPDGASYPFAIIRTVSENPVYSQDGDTNTGESIVQIDTYDDAIGDCITNAALIRAAVTGHRGTMGDYTAGGIFIRDWREEWAPDVRHYRVMNQFDLKYQG